MKHPGKVILKSEIFKIRKTPEKTPQRQRKILSRSPVPKSPRATVSKLQLKMDPNQLFQKVCCPNYNEILKKQPSMRKPTDILVHKTTQTDDLIERETRQLKMLSESLSKQLSNRNQSSLFPAQSFRKNSFTLNQPLQSQRIRDSTYKFEQLPFSKTQTHKKLSALPQQQSSIQQKHIEKSVKSGQQKSIDMRSVVSNDELAKGQYKKQKQIKAMLIHLIQSDSLLVELCEFYRQLPQSLQIPAYRKMLVQQFTVSPITNQSY